MKIKDLSVSLRPRERMLKYGPSTLSDAELLALILVKGSPGQNVLELSSYLFSEHGYDGLEAMSVNELSGAKGLGTVKSIQIKALFELAKRISSCSSNIVNVKGPKDIYMYMKDFLACQKQEHFYVLCLGTKNNIISKKLVALGTLDAALVHPREIFKEAIRNSARSIALVHNHPSGDPEPSDEDIRMTQDLIEASRFLNIEVLDHVIVAEKGYWSWKESMGNS